MQRCAWPRVWARPRLSSGSKHLRLIALILMALPALASAQAPVISNDPVADVQSWVFGFCGEATYEDGWAEVGDFNGDGQDDLIIRYWIACYEKERPFCGSKGCMTEAWFGIDDGNWQRAMAHYALAVEPVTFKGVQALKIYTDGLACGMTGGRVCESIHTWTDGDFLTVWTNSGS